MTSLDVNRREFMKIAAATGACLSHAFGPCRQCRCSKMIGIQIGAISFVDEGTERVLDMLQERGGVNILFLAGVHLRPRNRRQTDSRPASARSR